MYMSLSKLQELVMGNEAWRAAIHGIGHEWMTELNWTEQGKAGLINSLEILPLFEFLKDFKKFMSPHSYWDMY